MKKSDFFLLKEERFMSAGKILKIMKVLTFVMLVFAMHISASSYSQNTRLSLNLRNVSIKQVLTEIETQSEFRFLYSDSKINVEKIVEVAFNNKPVEEILLNLFEGTEIRYKIADKQILLFNSTVSPENIQQQKSVSGKVTDSSGATLPGVSVVVKGTTNGIITDIDGKYSLSNVPENAILQFSFVGMKAQEILLQGKTTINVLLVEDAIGIEEVVAIGYGTVKKSDLTGSVTSLRSDDIMIGNTQSPDMALKGKSAGVQITTVSGQPGAGPVVRIRGNSSILGSNDPLYVVDGVPLDGGGSAEGLEGVSSSPLTIISPSDIESMEVMKDASATAIYGSRGANGVILITTKRGKSGAFSANFNMSVGFQSVANQLKLTTPEQWAELWNESMDYKNGGLGKYDINNLPAKTNWLDEVFRTAPVQKYELAFNGGTDKLSYMLSGGYTSIDGIIMNTGFERYSIRTNLENKFTRWLTVGANLSATRTNSDQTSEGSIDPNTTIGVIPIASPIVPIYTEDGSYTQYVDVINTRPNPYASLKEIINNDVRNRLISNIYAEISFIKELKFRTNFATDIAEAKANYYAPSYIAEGKADQGRATKGSSSKVYWNSTNTLTYNKTFNEFNSLTAMIGAEWQKDVVEKVTTTGTGFANDNAKFYNIGEATKYSATSSYAAWQMQSFLARINYSYKNLYSLTITSRLDGSSRFGENNKNAFFPSAAASWRLSEEDFIKKLKFLSNLKLRASVGSSGEQGIPVYQTFSTLGASSVFVGGNNLYTGYFPTRSADPSLRWEKTKQVDVGLDFGVLKGRLNATFDYYYKRTEDLLYQKAVPASSGFSYRLENIGSVDNQGFELTLDAIAVDNKKFKWDININNSFNRNKLVELGDGRKEIINPPGGVSGGDIKSAPSILRVGEPLGLLYGYVSEGVIYDQAESAIAKQMGQVVYAPGELKIKDVSGDGKISTDDKTIIGDANPDFTGGMTNIFTYKGFQINILCQWVVGNDILNFQHLLNQRMTLGYNARKDWYDTRWQTNKPSRVEPRSGYDERAYTDVTYHVFDGSYLRVNNVTFSYLLSADILRRLHLKNLKISAGVDNLYTFTKYPGWTPDISSMGGNVMGQGIDGGSYPIPRTVTFGVNVGF